MAFGDKTDPRRKLFLAGALDFIIIVLGVAVFAASGNAMWLIGSIIIGAAVSAPLIFAAMRDLKERNNASR